MTRFRPETPPLFRSSALFLLAAIALLTSSVQAQTVRPSESVYVILRGAATGYYGDLDRNPNDNDILGGFDKSNLGFGVGGEVGYLFNENLSLGLAYWYQDLPPLNDLATNDSGEAQQLQILARYLPFDKARISPVVELGIAAVAGKGTESERGTGSTDEDIRGYGPVLGLGVDFALSPQFSLFLAAQSTVVFPDVALDGSDTGALSGNPNDDYDFDVLANVGGGLRYALRAPVTAVMIEGLECPAELETGESGTFSVYTNADATAPVSATWQWGDGTTGSGLTDRHSFSTPGTYTVTAMARNDGGTDSESCLVTVVEPPALPALAGCRATPSAVDVGEAVTVDATVTDANDVTVDFGDGTTASALPARHTYAAAGRYTVRITAESEFGTDTCTVPVTVEAAPVVDAFCADITELNPVFFGYGSTTLSADARARLDENIEVLRRCPDICVTINGYSDGAEPGDAQRVSQARAEAVRQYYVGQGLDADRFRAVGRGVAPGANVKEDPEPGDARARRADSIPSSCAGF